MSRKNMTAVRMLALAVVAGLMLPAAGPAAGAGDAGTTAATRSPIGIRGYGALLYSHYDFGPDQRSGESGAPPDDRAIFDLQRFVLELVYDFEPTLSFETEIEFEHGGTGSTLELEYEEFGEYELEVEKGGEIIFEQLHLTKFFSPALSVRVGHFIVPVGGTNPAHIPTTYFGSVRPEADTTLLPVTWHETGAEAFGAVGAFRWRVQLVNALDSTGFSSRNWIRDGHQRRFEQTRADDLALVGRLEYHGIPGLRVGAAVYRGDTTGNRPKDDMAGISAPLTIATADARLDRGRFRARGMVLFGSLENADLISAKNSRLSSNLQVARTPVAREAFGWGVEAGYDALPWLVRGTSMKLYPFVRYERFDSMHAVDGGVFADSRFDRRLTTVGANWFLNPRAVLKADWSVRSFGDERYRKERTVSVALGFTVG